MLFGGFWRRRTKDVLFCSNSQILLFLALFFIVSSLCISYPTYAEYSASITTSGEVNLNPEAGLTDIKHSDINVVTNCRAGYNLTLITSVSDNNLYLNGDSSNNTPGTFISPIDGSKALSSATNTWGYLLSSNTPSANDVFFPVSSNYLEPTVLKTTSETASSTDIDDNFSVYYGVNVDVSMAKGTYKMIPEDSSASTATNGGLAYYLTANPSCTISLSIDFNKNLDGQGGETGDDVANFPTAADNTTTDNILTLSDKTPSRDGYIFREWNTEMNGTGTAFYPGDTINIGIGTDEMSGDITLYAIWVAECDNGYICYDGNGANAGTMPSQEATPGNNIALLPSNFSRAGYGFAGWNTQPNGSGTQYGPNQNFKMPATGGVNLFARWIKPTGTLQTFMGASNMSTGDVIALRDSRDGEVYTVAKLADDNIWITENLRLVPNTANITVANTNNPTSNFLAAYHNSTSNNMCSNDNDTCNNSIQFNSNNINRNLAPQYDVNDNASSWYSYGVMYNWYTATAGNGLFDRTSGSVSGDLCPAGWHLPTGGSSGEWGTLNTAVNNGTTGNDTGLRAYPVNLIRSGDYNSSMNGGSGRGKQGRMWSATAASGVNAYRMGYSASDASATAKSWNKWDGFAIRCIYQGGNIPLSSVTVSFAGTGITSISFYNETYGTTTATPSNPTVDIVNDAPYTITANTSSGYELESWATTANGTLSSTTTNPTTYTITGETTLTATGIATPSYVTTVILPEHITSISFTNPDYPTQIITTSGDTVSLRLGVSYIITATSEEGYTVDTWTTSSNGILSDPITNPTTYTITGDTTLSLTTKEAELLTYTLLYDAGTGATGAPTDDEQTSYNNSYEFTISSTIPIKFGNTFLGYSETSGATTADYIYDSTNNTFTPSTITVTSTGQSTTKTIYAVWSEDTCPAGKICYFPNGADKGLGTMSDQTASSNDSATLIPSNYSRTDYGFVGWVTAEDATPYGPNATITTPDLSSSGLKLYAKWVASSGDMQSWSGCSSLAQGSVIGLTDTRDSNVYAVTKLADDNCWIMENLRLDVGSATINTSNTHNPTKSFVDATSQAVSTSTMCNTNDSVCFDQIQYNTNSLDRNLTPSKDKATNNVGWYSYGVYYNWYTATAGNGKYDTTVTSGDNNDGTVSGDICPKRWRIPTGNSNGEFNALNTAVNSGSTSSDAGLRAYPANFIWSGDYNNNKRTSGYSNGRIWTATAKDNNTAYRVGYASNTVTASTNGYNKWDGFIVRCIYNQNEVDYSNLTVTLPIGVSSITFTNGKYGTETATSANPTVSLAQGATYTMTASMLGYELDEWQNGANSTIGSITENPTTFSITDDTTLALTVTEIPTYTVTVNMDNNVSSVGFYNADYGTQTATSNGDTVTLRKGIPYTITGTYANNYEFASWSTTENGTLGSTSSATTTFTVTGNSTLSLTSKATAPAPASSCNTPVPGVTYMQDITSSNKATILGNMTPGNAYYIRDNRDQEPYCVSKLADGNLWMIDNLRLDITDSTVLNSLSTTNTNVDATSLTSLKSGNRSAGNQYANGPIGNLTEGNSYSVARANSQYKNTINSDNTKNYGNGSHKYGVYYNYCAASAGSYCYDAGVTHTDNAQYDLCPANWRIPTGSSSGEYNTLYTNGYSSDATNYRIALSTSGSGFFANSSASYQGSAYGFFWSSTRGGGDGMYYVSVSHEVYANSSINRYYGYSLRCLLDPTIPSHTVTVSLDSHVTGVSFTSAIDGTQNVTTDGGTVTLYENTPYTITASYASGYEFDSWTTGANGTLGDGTSATTTYTVTGNSTLSLTSKTTGPAPASTCNTPVPNITYMQDINDSNYNTVLTSLTTNEAYYLRDSRDNEPYCVSKLADNNLWMLDNLRLDLGNSTILNNTTENNTNASVTTLNYLKNGGGTSTTRFPTTPSRNPTSKINLTPWNSQLQNYYSIPMTNSTYKDTTTTTYGNGSGKIGVYYNYCAASAGDYCFGNGTSAGTPSGNATEDICPKGWRMPTGGSSGEYQTLYTAYSSSAINFRAALSASLSGYFYSGSAHNRGEVGRFWSSTYLSSDGMYLLAVGSSTGSVNTSFYSDGSERDRGHSIRCLLKSPTLTSSTVTVNMDNNVSSVGFYNADYGTQTVSSNGGTVTLVDGVEYTITGTYANGYEFASWSTTNGTLGDGTSATTTYTVTGNSTLSVTSKETPAYLQNATLADCGKTMYDIRDTGTGTAYTTAMIGSQCWMTTNLNLAGGTALSADDTDVTSAYISSFSTSNNLTKNGNTIVLPASSTSGFDTTSSYVYNSSSTDCTSTNGCYGYYSWDAATLGSGRSIGTSNTDAEQSICPKGWHLPTTYNGNPNDSTDFRKLMIALGGSSSIQTYSSVSEATIYGSLTASPNNFLLAGDYYNGSFEEGGNYGYYWSSTSGQSIYNARTLYFKSNRSVYSAYSSYRGYGFSVRCVLDQSISSRTVTVSLDSHVTGVSFTSAIDGTQNVTTNGGTVTLYENTPYTITASYASGYEFDSWTTGANGTLGDGTSATTTYTVTGSSTLSISSQILQPPSTCNTPVPGVTYMQDITNSNKATILGNMTPGNAYYIRDKRDEEPYCVSLLADNNLWMLDNLRLDITDSTILNSLTTTNTNVDATSLTSLKSGNRSAGDQYADGPIAQWDSNNTTDYYNRAAANAESKNTTTTSYGNGSGKIGVYYNYCAASAGSYCYDDGAGVDVADTIKDAPYDLCPANWRMPTGGSSSEYDTLYTTGYSSDATNFKTALSTPLSGRFYSGSASYQGSPYGNFWSSTYHVSNGMFLLYVDSSDVVPAVISYRNFGYSLRCLLNQPTPTSSTVTVNMDNNVSSVGFYNADYGTQTVSSNGGTVTLVDGVEYTITGTYANGYEFASWSTTNGTLGSTTFATTTYTVSGEATLTANSQVVLPDPASTCNTPVPNITYMQDINDSNYNTVLASLTTNEAYYLRDSRDNEPYCVSKLQDGNIWMLDNLRLDIVNNKDSLTSSNTNATNTQLNYLKNGGGTTSDQYPTAGVSYWTIGYSYSAPKIATKNASDESWNPNTVTESYGEGSGKIGVYYNYCAASAGTYCWGDGMRYSGSPSSDPKPSTLYDIDGDICPSGWHMPTSNTGGEYDALLTAYNNNKTATDSGSLQYNLSTPLSGHFYDSSARGQGSYGYFWSSTWNHTYRMRRLYVYSTGADPSSYYERYYGYSVRCLLGSPTPTSSTDNEPSNTANEPAASPSASSLQSSPTSLNSTSNTAISPDNSNDDTEATDSTDSSDSYVAPQGVTSSTESEPDTSTTQSINESTIAISVALASSVAATTSLIFFLLARRHDDEEDDSNS